jgi:hypothetical protein
MVWFSLVVRSRSRRGSQIGTQEGESVGTILGLHTHPCDFVLPEMFALEGCVPYL